MKEKNIKIPSMNSEVTKKTKNLFERTKMPLDE